LLLLITRRICFQSHLCIMDINKYNFYPQIIDILTAISRAHFVAVDLELSGVPSKDSLSTKVGKQTLQQRYLETKEAAERYQILQIGLTCVEQDVESNKYILRPYNFDLCPIINERLDVERIFSVQSGAAEFLLRNGFDMNKPFCDGVPYLTKSEAKTAREKHAKRQDKTALADIVVRPTEIESIAFLQRVREEIDAWKTSRKRDTPEYLNINSVAADVAARMFEKDELPEELSRFEKRLVHQLVRAEYPDLVTISKRGFIQIVRFNKAREDKISAERQRELEERIARQKGFHWLMEALQGNNFTGKSRTIDLREIAKDPETGEPIVADFEYYKSRIDRAQSLLRNNPRIIVGHNCFLDLIYIYNTFIGALPDTVEEFQQKLHAAWPVIVDTKYMSTHNCGDISPVSSLEQIAHQLSQEKKPAVETFETHDKYRDVEAFHEAGYDSYLTAQVAVRLSSKLRREGKFSDDIPGEDKRSVAERMAALKLASEAAAAAAVETGFTPSDPSADWKTHGDASLDPRNADDAIPYESFVNGGGPSRYIAPNETLSNGDGMPRFGTEFWKIYGNKLRVFGTAEGLCDLDPTAEPGQDVASNLTPKTKPEKPDAHTAVVEESEPEAEAEEGGVAV
jgi:poly(A)-specific ribonuclease